MVEWERSGGSEGILLSRVCITKKNGGQEAHIRERVKKAAAIMGRLWGIEKRRFRKDWEKRM